MSNITNFNGADVRQSRKPAHRIGFVYVVEDAATGRVKIGMSSKPEQRIGSVRSSAGIADGRTYTSIRVKNAKALEFSAHFAFAGHRLHGEFFMCSFEDAVAFVSAAAEPDAADDLDWAANPGVQPGVERWRPKDADQPADRMAALAEQTKLAEALTAARLRKTNARKGTAAGHAVAAHGGQGDTRPVKCEPAEAIRPGGNTPPDAVGILVL